MNNKNNNKVINFVTQKLNRETDSDPSLGPHRPQTNKNVIILLKAMQMS